MSLVSKVEVPWVVENGSVKSHVGNSLMSTSLQLRLPLSARHFGSRGSAKARCVASISTLFWQEGDEKVFGNSKKLMSTSSTTNTHHHHPSRDSSSSSSSSSTNPHHHHANERDSFRFDSGPSSSSSASSPTTTRHNYYDSNNNNLTPNPFIFNSTALVTGKWALSFPASTHSLQRPIPFLSIPLPVDLYALLHFS